jgi:predicted TIM-barrel fold metal-dependent hydrolase
MIAEGTVDYLCNAFTPDRRAGWEKSVGDQGVPLKIVKDAADDFAEPAEMVERMDRLGIDTLVLPTGDLGPHPAYDVVATRWDEAEKLVADYPGRFASTAVISPGLGMADVREVRARLADEWVVGLWLHTHSWDRRFDHADLYPYYALASEFDVPVAMQAGTSGGLFPSECGQPIGIDRPAIYFPDTRFVLSHTGWPWVDEAVAMALKFPNVFLGTAAYPPRHWNPAVVNFLTGPGKRKVLFGSNFPTVGHTKAQAQVDELQLDEVVKRALMGETARQVFPRLKGAAR